MTNGSQIPPPNMEGFPSRPGPILPPTPTAPESMAGTVAQMGDTVRISHDIVAEGAVAFLAKERVRIEKVEPNPQRPEYKYVVNSRRLRNRFQLSDKDIIPRVTKGAGATSQRTANRAGGRQPSQAPASSKEFVRTYKWYLVGVGAFLVILIIIIAAVSGGGLKPSGSYPRTRRSLSAEEISQVKTIITGYLDAVNSGNISKAVSYWPVAFKSEAESASEYPAYVSIDPDEPQHYKYDVNEMEVTATFISPSLADSINWTIVCPASTSPGGRRPLLLRFPSSTSPTP